MVRCNDLLAAGTGALDMLSNMPSLKRLYLNGLPTLVDVEVRTTHMRIARRVSQSPSSAVSIHGRPVRSRCLFEPHGVDDFGDPVPSVPVLCQPQ